MMRFIHLLTVFILFNTLAFSQVSYYADTFKGGVTGGGYAPSNDGNGIGTINVHIEPGSTIRKAYLFAGRLGPASPVTIKLNGTSVIFNNADQVSPSFMSLYGGVSGVHAEDVTSIVTASVTTYTVTVPAQAPTSDRYSDFYLYITYDNASLPNINTEFFLNNHDFGPLVYYTFVLTAPVNTTQPVAIGLDLGYICGNYDLDTVFLNGAVIGNVYGPEINSGLCGGPYANFYYQNNTVSALGDDNADQAMNGGDVLSNAQALIPNGSTSFIMKFTHVNNDNSRWGFFIVSGGACTPPVANVQPADTAVCYGNSVMPHASGGLTYHWSPTAGVSDSDGANPLITPQATTTYTVTVSDNCGSSTSQLTILVNPTPPTPIITISNDTLYCGIDTTYASYQWYYNDTIIPGATATFYFATQSGNYNVAVTDKNGCNISVGINIIINEVADYNTGHFIFIAPNPSPDQINLSLPVVHGNHAVSISLINAIGQCVLEERTRWNESIPINIETLASGIYFVQLTSDEGRWLGKFVKQ